MTGPGRRHPDRRLLAGRHPLRAPGRGAALRSQGAAPGRLRRDPAEDPRGRSAEAEHQAEHDGRGVDDAGARTGGQSARTLVRQLRGDLDWITMKALEKDRTRRYGSPSELAADIERYLHHEPVLARPPSTVYRARKYVRRHRVGVGVARPIAVLLGAFAVTHGAPGRTGSPSSATGPTGRPRPRARSPIF